ncbi:glutaredoxin-c6 [Phtheirospermum japonicum]|uniref:Glutaredoxin-c6 n=1 Tax=Phtheirospermum japonicum TaxID=374723 RepID=A0A830DJ47_9LAMI|nr:glutaredoxin-c6 [Phtheirospermum japonicum]
MALAKAKESLLQTPSSKSYCPYCVAVKELLRKLGATFKVIELNTRYLGVESLYTPAVQLCRNCNEGLFDDGALDEPYYPQASPLTPESNHRNISGGEEQDDMDPYGGLFDDEQAKILSIKEQLEDPHPTKAPKPAPRKEAPSRPPQSLPKAASAPQNIYLYDDIENLYKNRKRRYNLLISGCSSSDIYQETLEMSLAHYFGAKLLVFDCQSNLKDLTSFGTCSPSSNRALRFEIKQLWRSSDIYQETLEMSLAHYFGAKLLVFDCQSNLKDLTSFGTCSPSSNRALRFEIKQLWRSMTMPLKVADRVGSYDQVGNHATYSYQVADHVNTHAT